MCFVPAVLSEKLSLPENFLNIWCFGATSHSNSVSVTRFIHLTQPLYFSWPFHSFIFLIETVEGHMKLCVENGGMRPELNPDPLNNGVCSQNGTVTTRLPGARIFTS